MSGELTLGRWIRDRARTTPARVAIDFRGAETTYAELDERSDRIAAGLLEAGLVPGDRVATLTGTSPEHVVVFFACAKAGLILMPLNTRLAAPELAYQLADAEPAILLCSEEFAELGATLHKHTAGLEELVLNQHKVLAPPGDDDGLLLVYTSGTTGKPKGALLTHANCFWTNLSFDRVAGLGAEDTVLQVLPQFHVGGWNVQPLLAWWKGATVVLEPTFDPARALALIAEKHVTTMMGVPATYLFMAQEPGFAKADLWTLRRAVVGGAPMPEALLEAWHERGVEIVQGYGLTEAAPNVLCLPPEDAARKRGFAGKPYPHVDVALRDPETGRLLEGVAEGELVVKGPERLRRLLAEPGGDRGRLRGRLAPHRRRRRARRGGLLPDRRPHEGHGHLRRRERLSGRDRERAARAPGGRGGRGRRRAGRALGRGLPRVRRPARRGDRGGAARVLPRPARPLQGAARRSLRRCAAAERARQGRQVRAAGARAMKALTARGERTRRQLLDSAERIFAELGYHDASIVKITEAAGVGQGTFYLYFTSKKEVFDEVVLDLNARVRHAMTEAAASGKTRAEQELLGFGAFFRFTAEHPALYRIIRQAEFVSPETLQRTTTGCCAATRPASSRRWRPARSPGRSRGARLEPDGDRRARRHALDPLERGA